MPDLIANTIRFATDSFGGDDDSSAPVNPDDTPVTPFTRKSLLISKKYFNTNGVSSVDGFEVSGAEPAGTVRRFVFKVDDKLWIFSSGSLKEYTYSDEYDDVIKHGNTAAGLTNVTSIPDWVNKKIYPIIALKAKASAEAMPSVKLALKTTSAADTFVNTVESVEFELEAAGGSIPRIAEITEQTSCTGNGSVDITVKLLGADGNWSDYMSLSKAAEKEASAVQFKFLYKVTSLDGSDTAKVDSVTIKHSMGATAVSGDTAEIYSIVNDYEHDLQTCYVVVKHAHLIDSVIKAYANFMPEPKSRELISLGVATGAHQELILGVDGVADVGIDQSSLQLFADGKPLSDFDYNTEVGRIYVNASKDVAITASYDYDRAVENWVELPLQISQQPYSDDGTYMSRFGLTLSEADALGKKMSNVRICLFRTSGSVTKQKLGTATGFKQMFALEHAAVQSSIKFTSSKVNWSYDDDSQIITCSASKGTAITISYDWIGEQQTVYSWSAGWAPLI